MAPTPQDPADFTATQRKSHSRCDPGFCSPLAAASIFILRLSKAFISSDKLLDTSWSIWTTSVKGKTSLLQQTVTPRAFGPPRFCVERSSLLVSRGAWQGRTLEGSGGSGARFWTSAVLRGRVVTFALRAKPWQGRTLESPGSSGARFWTPRFCMEGSPLLLSRAKPWQGRTLESPGGSGARFWTPAVLRGTVVCETVAGAYSRGLWR